MIGYCADLSLLPPHLIYKNYSILIDVDQIVEETLLE